MCNSLLHGKDPHLPDHVAEEAEVETGAHARQDDEGQRQVGAHVRHPDGVEGVAELNASLAHVEHKQAHAATQHRRKVAPVGAQTVALNVILVTKLKPKK